MDFIPLRNDFLGGIRLRTSGQYRRWHAGLHHSRLAEITPGVDDDLSILAQRPPDDVGASELELFVKRFDDPRKFALIGDQIDECFVTILFALSQKNAPAIGKNAI